MSTWSNPEEWSKLYRGESCVICLQGRPLHTLTELGWLAGGLG